VHRGNLRVSNLQAINAILYVAERDGKWRRLPRRFGNWHTIYTRMNRWSKSGVLNPVFEPLQREQILRINIEAVAPDGASVEERPGGNGASEQATNSRPSAKPAEIGRSGVIWLPRMLGRP